jgi:hypothetical protein
MRLFHGPAWARDLLLRDIGTDLLPGRMSISSRDGSDYGPGSGRGAVEDCLPMGDS